MLDLTNVDRSSTGHSHLADRGEQTKRLRWFAGRFDGYEDLALKRLCPSILLVLLLLLVGPTLASGAELFQRLEGREFEGRSIVGAHGTHPVRRPDDLQLFFGTAEISGYGNATPTLYWRSRCNGHDYLLAFVHQRLHTSAQLSTEKTCAGQPHREERWLENFFSVNLAWSLKNGRLTLTSGQRRIVLIGEWLLSPNR